MKSSDNTPSHSPILRKGLMTYLLGSIVALPTLSLTLIVPAVPVIKDALGASYGEAQLIITVFLMAMAAGLLIVGLLSDRFGRRPLLLWGTALFFAGSIIGYFAPTIFIIIIARALQGLGAAALMTTGRIIANDIYESAEASRALSSVTAVQSIVPVLALALGGIIVEAMGWRATMALMALASAIVFAQTFILISETNHNRLTTLRMTALITAFQTVLKSRNWQFYSICAGMQIGMFYAMNGYISYHFARLGASVTEFGFYYATISVGYLVGNLINRRFGAYFSLGKWVLYGSYIGLATIALITAGNEWGLLTPLILSCLLSLIGLSHGLLVANAIISSMRDMGPHSGSASGIGGAMHMLIGALAGSVIISIGGATNFSIAMMVNAAMALCSIIAARQALRA